MSFESDIYPYTWNERFLLNQFCMKVYKIIQILSRFYIKFYLKNKI